MNEDRHVNDDHPGTEELAQRLGAYASARLSPTRAASARIRAAIIEEARMRALEAALGRSPHRHRSGPRRVTALLLAATLTLAAAVAVSATSSPGGPLYGARIWLETVTLPASADARALERVRQIEERLVDAEQAAASGNGTAVAAAVAAYRDAVETAVAEVGTDADRLARLEGALGLHVTVLETLAGKVPAAAAPGIGRAIETSQKAVAKIKKAKPSTGPGPAATEPATEPTTEPTVEPTQKPGRTGKPDGANGPAATEGPARTPRGGPPASPEASPS